MFFTLGETDFHKTSYQMNSLKIKISSKDNDIIYHNKKSWLLQLAYTSHLNICIIVATLSKLKNAKS